MQHEKQLVIQAIAGNHEAFDALAEICRPWLFGLCFRLVQDRPTAEDLVQETLLQSFRKIKGLRDPERFRVWLSRIAINTCRMYLRKVLSDITAPCITECLPQTKEESPLGLDEALSRISIRHRRMLRLCYGEELSHAELGEVLALSLSAVKSRLHRAREQLRKEMLKMMTPNEKARIGVTDKAPWRLHTILLVEPEKSIRESLQKGLAEAGYKILVLPTGEAALTAAAEHNGQMLILDKHCGELNWVEVLTLLQADAWARENLPVGVLVDREERDVFLAWQAGAMLCLTRPPSTKEVVGFVKRLARLWSQGGREACAKP